MLGALRLDLTTSQIALAAHFGHSRWAVWRRMRELNDHGLIEGKVALLDAQKMGFRIHALLTVSMAKHSVPDRSAFVAHIQSLPGVLRCFSISGDSDYHLHLIAHDMNECSVTPSPKGKLVDKGAQSLNTLARPVGPGTTGN